MFNLIGPKIYRKLRERSGLTQGELGKRLGGTRHTIRNFESGKTRPDAAQESRLLEITKCSRLEFVHLACEELGELVDTPVGLLANHVSYEPTTLLTRVNNVLLAGNGRLSPARVRRVHRKSRAVRMLSLLFDDENADLEEDLQECRAEIEEGMDAMPSVAHG